MTPSQAEFLGNIDNWPAAHEPQPTHYVPCGSSQLVLIRFDDDGVQYEYDEVWEACDRCYIVYRLPCERGTC